MGIPTYDRFIEPILRLLAARPEGMSAREAHEAAADALSLSPAQRQLMLSSGAQAIYKNRAGWAHDRLKRTGLSSSPRRGWWQITAQGLDYVRQRPQAFLPDEIDSIARDFLDMRLRPASVADTIGIVGAAPIGLDASPDERLSQALNELRQSVIDELLDTLSRVSPSHFESIVLDVLHKMGYGIDRSDLQRIGGSSDGGVDGVISLDRLGLEKVYVQAKRWQETVGRPQIQAFYGALAGQRARKGVFITTSCYTVQALDFVATVEGIVLVNGQRLAELMIEHEVGVSLRPVHIPRLDSDYFNAD